jgi:proteasome accessory factor C
MVRTLPLIGLPGEDGYFQMPNEMFEIDWDLLENEDVVSIREKVALERAPRLTAREAAALLAGLQLVRAVPGVAGSETFSGLVDKLARGASAIPADVVVAPERADAVRSLVARALREGVAVSFDYRAPDAEPTTRTVDPETVLITGGQWYLQGWCHLRRATRTFHLDRVSSPVLTDIPITHAAEDARSGAGATGEGEQIVTVRFPSALAPLLGSYLHHAEREEAGEVMTARIPLSDARTIKRLAARLGGGLEVLAPAAARAAAADWARSALALYPEALSPEE